MNDRPDWLPEPTAPSVRPLSERLHLGAVSVASLLLAIVGVALTAVAFYAAWTIWGGATRRNSPNVAMFYAAWALIALSLAYLLRWCLRRERERARK